MILPPLPDGTPELGSDDIREAPSRIVHSAAFANPPAEPISHIPQGLHRGQSAVLGEDRTQGGSFFSLSPPEVFCGGRWAYIAAFSA